MKKRGTRGEGEGAQKKKTKTKTKKTIKKQGVVEHRGKIRKKRRRILTLF